MRKVFAVFVGPLLGCLFSCSVAMGQNQIKLSGYSFSAANPVVGKILAGEKSPKVKLASKSEALFTLGKDNTIQVKKSALQTPANFLELVLVSEKGEADTFHIVKDEFLSNRVIAHRGAWKNTGATENSISALQHAIKMGCTGSEFDIHMSSDSVLFVHHDHDMNGVHLEKTPAAELAKLKLANRENLPTLEAHLLEGLKQNKTKLILEIKPSSISKERGQALAQKVVEMVQKHKAQGWVDYISFDYDILLKVLELEPSSRVAYLKGDKAPAELAKDNLYGLDYNQKIIKKNPNWIDEAHKLGLTVNVWTVNDPKTMDWLIKRNVKFITTNEPEMLLEKTKKKGGK